MQIAKAAVELSAEQEVTLIHCKEPVELTQGHILGSAQLVEEVSEEATLLDVSENVTVNAFLPPLVPSSPVSEAERREKITNALGLDCADFTSAECDQLKAAVFDYACLFALNPFELGVTDLVSHSIDTSNHAPIHQPPRRTPFSLRQKVTEMVQQMLTQGVVCPSHSPWASPVMLVQKIGAYAFA